MNVSDKLLPVIGVAMCGVLGWAWAEQDKAKTHDYDQVRAVSQDLGCTYIEQSYKNPQNYYIDCGDDQIRIIHIDRD